VRHFVGEEKNGGNAQALEEESERHGLKKPGTDQSRRVIEAKRQADPPNREARAWGP
jgi:hypothetical protein